MGQNAVLNFPFEEHEIAIEMGGVLSGVVAIFGVGVDFRIVAGEEFGIEQVLRKGEYLEGFDY